MSQTALAATEAPAERRIVNDRRFYSAMAIAMAMTVLAGFAPTYYFPAVGSGQMITISGQPVTLLVHAHGVLFTGWVLLFIVQTGLVATHRVKVHQRLGVVGGALAAAMIVVGASTAVRAAAAGAAPPEVDPLAFLVVPLVDVTLFAGFVGAALWHRRSRETHKRLMLLAYVSIMAAAVARLPGMLPLGPLAFFGLAFVFVGAGIAYDFVSRRRVHPVYLWGGALLVISVPARLIISETAAWRAFAELLTG